MNLPAPDKAAQPYLPHYEVIEPLGEGAVATVYKVRAIRDGAIFALKSLKPGRATTERSVKRFEDEFRILHRLHHPSLPEVFDYGTSVDGGRYIVMELVDGVPLGAYFTKHEDSFWLLVYELTEALSFIHEHKLLHLDLKPGNVLIKSTRAYGEEVMPLAVLIDFGVSYRRDEGGKAKMIGTPAYMPPEIVRGEENPTRAADYYSLGVILYEMVEGRVPFRGSMDDVLRAHLNQKVEFGKSRVEYASVYPWIEKLMSKESGERLEAFGDFRRMIGERVAGSVDGLEKAYALGFIESLGFFGKAQIWDEVTCWAAGVTPSRKPPNEGSRVGAAEFESIELTDVGADFATKVRQGLLSTSTSDAVPDAVDPRHVRRYMNVTGPPESGKAFLLRALRAHLLAGGRKVISLDDPREYAALVATDPRKKQDSPDPRAFAVDRFTRGWNRIIAEAGRGGVLISVPRVESLSSEARQFLEYVIKRVELALSYGAEPGVFVAVASENPHLKKELCMLIADENNCLAVEIPPPSKTDVESIVSEFHGHMSGAEERRSLAEYLNTNLTADGAVMTSLRHAVTEGGLIYRGGHWEFRGVADTLPSHGGSGEYYQQLLPELPTHGRTLAQWLSCHRGPLSIRQVAKVANMKLADARRAVAEIKPYRLLDVAAGDGDVHIRFASEGVREAVYSTIDRESRAGKHQQFLQQMAEWPRDSREDLESLIFHHEQLDRQRDALLARVRAVQLAKKHGDVHAVRRFCAGGIAYIRDHKLSWTAERFFIKAKIDAEWVVSNYSGIVQTIEEHFTKRRRTIPASFLYKYAYALDSSGRFRELENLISKTRDEAVIGDSLRDQLLVVQASGLHAQRRYQEALSTLKSIHPERLPWWVLLKFYAMNALVHDGIGNETDRTEHVSALVKLTQEKGDYEHLLRIYYHQALSMLGSTEYRNTKKLLARSIRLASRNRVYRSLCTMYYAASGVYYEEANYGQALRYLDKAIRLATDIGMWSHVHGYQVRQGSNYRELGRYGTAIRYLESLLRVLQAEHYFFAQLILLDTYTLLNSERADSCAEEIATVSRDVQPGMPLGLFHFLEGNRLVSKKQFGDARVQYANALEMYESARVEDDWVRTKVAVARSYVLEGAVGAAATVISDVSDRVKNLESPSVRAAFDALQVQYVLARGGGKENLEDALRELDARRQVPASMATRMTIYATLLEGYARTNNEALATECFSNYYDMLKEVCSDLSDADLISSYTGNPECTRLINVFRNMKKESPG